MKPISEIQSPWARRSVWALVIVPVTFIWYVVQLLVLLSATAGAAAVGLREFYLEMRDEFTDLAESEAGYWRKARLGWHGQPSSKKDDT